MMTSAQCLAKAVQMDALAVESDTESGRDAYASLAAGWRRNARLALEQESSAQSRWTD